MDYRKRRLKIFVFDKILLNHEIEDFLTDLKRDGSIPLDSEFVASSTQVVRGSFSIKLWSSEFSIVEEAMAFDFVDMRKRVEA